MAHDVFISYAHKDKPTGDAVCATLEARGIRCWMAPRDVLPGVIYSGAIVEAIHASRVFVLVFSAEANISPHVMRELERAVNDGIPVLPLRIEDVPLSPSMEYFISTPHWLDALTPPLEKHLVRLAETVQLLLRRAETEAEAKRAAAPPAPPKPVDPEAAPPAPVAIEPVPATPPPARTSAAVSTQTGDSAARRPVEPPPVERVGDTPALARDKAPVAGGASVRGLPRWAIGGVAGLVLVIVAGLVISSMPDGRGTGLATATPSGSAPPGTPTAPGSSPSIPLATPSRTATVAAATFTVTGSMAGGRYNHTATLLANGKVLVAGGEANAEGVLLDSAELYDPATGSWTATGSMTTPRAHHVSVLLENGKVLAIGGEGELAPGVPDSAELYDPETGSWTRTGNTHGSHATATLLDNGEVLIAGGDGGFEPQHNSEIYNPTSGKWRAGGAMQQANRLGLTATLLANGRVLVVGGAPGQSGPDSYPASRATAEVYDPGTGKWTRTGSLATPRANHVAVLLADGRVLVASGSLHEPELWTEAAGYMEAPLASAEVYDPETGEWTAIEDLAVGRAFAGVVTLADGRVVVIGGRGSSTATACEVYDPERPVWTFGPTAKLAVWLGHTATLLADGRRVLIAGGGIGNATGVAVRAAQLFDPGD